MINRCYVRDFVHSTQDQYRRFTIMPFNSLGESKSGRFLSYRSKNRSDRVSKGSGSSTSDFGLTSLFRATSISGQPFVASKKSKSQPPGKSEPKSHHKMKKQPFGNFGFCRESERKDGGESWRQAARSLGIDDLSVYPKFRAGILIVVTSPEGEDALGICDGENPNKSGKHDVIIRGSRGGSD